MKFLAAYIMQGRLAAMLVAAALAMLSLLLPPVSIVSSATVALITLRRGASEGLVVLACACVVSALLGWMLFDNIRFTALYGLVLWLPIWIIAVILREGRHLSLAVELATFMGMILVVGYYLYNPDASMMWQGILDQIAIPLLQAPDMPIARVQQSLKILAQIMTGAVASGMVYSTLLGLFLGRWWQAMLYNPGGFRSEYLNLRVPTRLALLTIAVIGLAFLDWGLVTEIARNIAVLLFALYTVIGVAVLHAVFSGMRAKRFAVPLLYLTLMLIPHTLIMVAIIGLTDCWLDLRNKQSIQNSA